MYLLELETQMSYIYVHLMVTPVSIRVNHLQMACQKIFPFTEKNIYIYKPLLQQPVWYCQFEAGGQHYHFKMNNASK